MLNARCAETASALKLEQVLGVAPALILLANAIGLRNSHVVEKHLVDLVISRHGDDRLYTHARAVHVDQQEADALLWPLGIGGAHQAARQHIDNGNSGEIIGGSCYCQSHGMEHWHPDPTFFFQPGGGPVLDMGAYYVSNLVQFLGPVKRVVAMASKPFPKRTVTSEPNTGAVIDVNVDTSVRALLEFQQGAQVSFTVSWDVWSHEHNHMELYGTKRTLYVPDPNHFGDVVRVKDGEAQTVINPLQVLGTVNFEDNRGGMMANYRGIGLADMVAGIHEGRPHRCSGELALHVVDVLLSIVHSAQESEFVTVQTHCERPAALDDTAAKRLMRG